MKSIAEIFDNGNRMIDSIHISLSDTSNSPPQRESLTTVRYITYTHLS